MRRLFIGLFIMSLVVSMGAAQDKITLERSIQIALEQNPTVVKARAEIGAAEGVVGQARAGFLPQLNLSAGIGKYYAKPQTMEVDLPGMISPSEITIGTDQQADMYNYSVKLSQALFTGGRLTNSLGVANKGLDIAKEELVRITQDVEFKVIDAYYNVLKAHKFVELNEQAIEMALDHLKRTNAMLKVGISTKADVLRNEVQVANAQLGLTKAKQALEIAKSDFNNTLGNDLEETVDIQEIGYSSNEAASYDYNALVEIAYESRPDWKQYVLAKKVSEEDVSLAYSQLWPIISLVGNYDVNSIKYKAYENNTESWTALLSGSWDIFDGTASWNKIKENKAKLEARKAEETAIRRGIALEVKNADFNFKSAIENLKETVKALELAEENFRIAKLRYETGSGTNLDMIDAQLALTQARTDHLLTQHDLQISKAKINKAVGRNVY
jgi:outer membrane protein